MPEYLPMLAGWIATASAAAAVTCLMIAWATGRMERLEVRRARTGHRADRRF